MRRGILLVLVLGFLLTPMVSTAQSIELVNSSGELQSTIQSMKSDRNVLANLMDFFRALDFSVDWDESVSSLIVDNEGTQFRFRPESKFVRTGDNKIDLSQAPVFNEGALYLDIGSLVELFGKHSSKSLIWNNARNQLQLRNQSQWSTNEGQEDPIGEFIKGSQDDEKMLVIIDPGHGGRDPGAIGTNGLQEKKVVLEMAQKMEQVMSQNFSEIDVRLTRSSDEFLPLQKRTQIANQLNADLFISLHANSGRSSVAKGFELFTLSGEASDPSAKELAKIENSALRYEGYSKDELDDVSWILWQLRSTIHTRESRRVASIVSSAMEERLPIRNRGLKQAPFWVLKDARMPAILVETGFLSNPEEERRLQTSTYQQKVARSIAEAVNSYRKKRSE
ncbi:MAG: N-acetylmuramoyl-L-alanine amidase [bacterium]